MTHGHPTALVGTWVGRGEGSYPTIETFAYDETVDIATVAGKPFLTYAQRTSHPHTGAPMHSEVGYLRFPDFADTGPGAVGGGTGAAELVVAQPTGVTECHRGTVVNDGDTVVIDLASTSVGCTPSAREVTAVRRRLVVTGDALAYELWMAAVGQPDTLHLRARLERRRD